MGRRYYCDYCDKTMSCAPSIIRTHNNGILHQKAKHEHFQKYKDAETILAEEVTKKPCARFPLGQCQFGGMCRYSHYTREEILHLQNYVTNKKQSAIMASQPSFQDLYNKLQTDKVTTPSDGNTILVDKNGVTHTFPWTYNEELNNHSDLPPSLKPIDLENFQNVTYSEWG